MREMRETRISPYLSYIGFGCGSDNHVDITFKWE